MIDPKSVYNTLALGRFLSLREKGKVDIKKFLEEHEKHWPKYRGDINQVVKHL